MGKITNVPRARGRSTVHPDRYLELFEKLSPLVGASSVEGIALASCELVADLLHVEACSIMMTDSCRECLTMLAASHIPRAEWPSICVTRGDGLAGIVWESGESILLRTPADFRARGMEPQSRYGRPSCIAVPLRFPSGEVKGVINVANPRGDRAFTQRDVELLEAAARLIAAGLEGARLTQDSLELTHRLEQILNNLHVGVAALDPDHMLTQCNQRFAQMFAAEGKSLVGRPAGEVLDPGLFSVCRRLMRELTSASPMAQERFEGEHGGKKRLLEVTLLYGNPSCDGPASHLLMIEDVSQGEEVKRLREADSLKRSFLRIISHELRTPLTVLGGAIPLLDSCCSGEANGSTEKMLLKVRQLLKPNVQRLTNVVNTVLDVVDIENGKLKLLLAPVNLHKLLEERVEMLKDVAAAKEVVWDLQFDLELGEVTGDRQRLRQVFYELLDNAIKFSPQGGKVTLRTLREGGMAAVSMINRGEPIEGARRGEVFEKFYQLDQSLTRKSGGCGLGLYLSRNIAALHGGGLQIVDGEAGETVFKMSLPLAQPDQAGA